MKNCYFCNAVMETNTPCILCEKCIRGPRREEKTKAKEFLKAEIESSQGFLRLSKDNHPGTIYARKKIEVFEFILEEYLN